MVENEEAERHAATGFVAADDGMLHDDGDDEAAAAAGEAFADALDNIARSRGKAAQRHSPTGGDASSSRASGPASAAPPPRPTRTRNSSFFD